MAHAETWGRAGTRNKLSSFAARLGGTKPRDGGGVGCVSHSTRVRNPSNAIKATPPPNICLHIFSAVRPTYCSAVTCRSKVCMHEHGWYVHTPLVLKLRQSLSLILQSLISRHRGTGGGERQAQLLLKTTRALPSIISTPIFPVASVPRIRLRHFFVLFFLKGSVPSCLSVPPVPPVAAAGKPPPVKNGGGKRGVGGGR